MQISERREGLALLTILTLFMGAITLTVALKNFNVISHFMTCVLWTIISSNINDYLSLSFPIFLSLSLCALDIMQFSVPRCAAPSFRGIFSLSNYNRVVVAFSSLRV